MKMFVLLAVWWALFSIGMSIFLIIKDCRIQKMIKGNNNKKSQTLFVVVVASLIKRRNHDSIHLFFDYPNKCRAISTKREREKNTDFTLQLYYTRSTWLQSNSISKWAIFAAGRRNPSSKMDETTYDIFHLFFLYVFDYDYIHIWYT